MLTAFGFSQQAIPAAGGTVSGASGSFSISVGQTAYGYYKNATHSVSQGVQQTYAAYVTQVKSAQCGTVLANLDTAIVADTIVGAQKYRFEVTTASNVRTIERTTNSFSLTQLSGGACYSTAFAIRVAVQYNAIWYDYGSSCTVTTPNNAPTAAAQTFCSGATVGNLTANGTAIKWYADAISGTALSTTTLTSATYYASQTVNGCESTRTAVSVTVFPKTTPTFAQIAAVCSGATIAALPTTSTNAVTGTWSPALNNLATTTYTFTPTAGLCANTTTMTITVNSNVTPTFTAVAPICSGASLWALPATSINNITGTWSPAINNAATTLYTFTPTAGTCTNTVAMTITVNSKTTPSFTQVAAVCAGVTISALPTTSTNSVTGTWSPAINNTLTTTYTFTPTAGLCASTATMTIAVNALPTAPTATGTQTFCASPAPTIASLTATGTAIQWYAAATSGIGLASATTLLTGTSYYASQTAGNCESTRTAVAVSINDPQISASATTVCSGTAVALTASTILTGSSVLPTNLQSGLVGYWPFNGNANDLSGNGNNGTVNGATLTTDRFGNANSAYSFNGSNNFIDIANSSIAAFGTSSFTAFAWYNASSLSTNTGNIIRYDDCLSSSGWGIQTFILNSVYKIKGIEFSSTRAGGSTVVQPQPNTNDIWKSVTFVRDVSQMKDKLYIDGILVSEVSFSGIINIEPGSPLRFGSCAGYEYFKGKIDNVSLHNRALTLSEIQQLNNAPTYLWSTSETTGTINPTPTATTTYWCDVTTNGVTCRKEITITVTPKTTPTFTQVAAVCSGTTITALPTTSTNGITGTWSPAINNTITTLYTFTPTGGLCANTATMTITVNPKTTPTFTQAAPICFGATSLTPLPTTSNNGISGTWSPALNSSAPTTYTFTPTAGLCANTATMTTSIVGTNTNIALNKPATASGFYGSSTPSLAFDGILTNGWTTPAYTGWIQVDLQGSFTINKLKLVVGQYPNGNTTHQIYAAPSIQGPWTLVETLSGYTSSGDVLVRDYAAAPLTNIGAIKLSTLSTPSWVSWGEIEVYALTAVNATISAATPLTFCEGGTVALNANIGSGYTYQWKKDGTTISGETAASYNATTSGSYSVFVTDGNGCSALSEAKTVTVTPKRTPTFTQVAAVCVGATIAALPTTSTNAVTGTWSPAVNNTATTTYTFTPTDAVCNNVTTMTITVNPKTTPTFTQVAAVCSGATISALPTTSTNAVAGTWSPALNNLVTTTYTFTPTDAVCNNGATMTITVNPKTTPTFTQVAAVCSGATIAALPTTANNAVAGTWSPALNNLVTTTYTFTSTDAVCNNVATMTITVTPKTTPTFTQVEAICSGASLSALPTTSNNSLTGTWSPALDNSATTTYTFTPTAGLCATTATMTITVNPHVTPTFTQVAAICAGASLSALPTTSNNSLTGTWSPSLDNTTTTTYTFTPTVGLCANTATMTITVNPNVTPTFTQVAAICSGASLSALPTTSNNSLTGTWSPSLDNTTTTTYTFTPTAGSCATTATMTITVNPNVTPTFPQVAAICSGASLSALPTTSNNSLTGTWSPSLDNTTTTTYTFTPTAGLCATSATMTITVNPNVTPTFTQVEAICAGASLSALPMISNNSLTGTWSPALNNAATTTYTFTPTVGLCATSATMTITVNPNIAPTFTQVSAICAGASLSALPTTSNNSLSGTWSPALDNAATTTYTFTPTARLCATTATMTITVKPNITPSFTQVASVCSGSTMNALPTTSNNGYDGTWSPALNNLSSTNYTFTPTVGLCATTTTMFISVITPSTPSSYVVNIPVGTTLNGIPGYN
ncbi:MAG: hypothetical protein CFE24_14320, partial [Flavobacterium sp. BFFFF2]